MIAVKWVAVKNAAQAGTGSSDARTKASRARANDIATSSKRHHPRLRPGAVGEEIARPRSLWCSDNRPIR
ncbi:hypothetical protein [Saccharothrix luteola]|uniref:hypothetical protein n=1 Tax=Saccharothrix luteola TaxID=2893018 RepID=UPI001E613064|nr:hypothetical protein [Saccharothrix luteola]MCC8246655.1 hypothetical protein [Saccharothrix luteola]